MKNKILAILAFAIPFVTSAAIITSPVSVYAANSESTDICSDKNVPDPVKEASGCNNKDESSRLNPIITNILNTVIGISGLVAVVFIIIGGFGYMTSTGDAAKTKKAKDTILYATIGLVVCALAFAIANFAINIINNPN